MRILYVCVAIKNRASYYSQRDIVFDDMSLHEKRLGSYLVELNVTQEKAQVALNERKKILQDTIAVINKMKVDLHEIIKPYSNVHEKNRVVTVSRTPVHVSSRRRRRGRCSARSDERVMFFV